MHTIIHGLDIDVSTNNIHIECSCTVENKSEMSTILTTLKVQVAQVLLIQVIQVLLIQVIQELQIQQIQELQTQKHLIQRQAKQPLISIWIFCQVLLKRQ